MGCNMDPKAKQKSGGSEKPTCTPCSHLLLAGQPALLPVPWPRLLAPMATSCCPLWGVGPVLQRQRRFLSSARTKEPKGAAVTEANKGRVRPGRWATAGTCHGVSLPIPVGQGAGRCCPHAEEWGFPRCREAKAVRAAQDSVASPCCALLCSPSSSVGAPMGCGSVASGCPSRHPAGPVSTWAGGQAGRDEAKIKLLMSPSVTRPPITWAGNEEMMECDEGRGAGCRGSPEWRHLGGVTISLQLPHHHQAHSMGWGTERTKN